MASKHKTTALSPREVFLSHSHNDLSATLRLATTLRRHGIPIWYSERNIAGAQQWVDEIGAALDRCDWFIILLTPNAVQSKWVKREVTYVLNEDRYEGRIVPLLLKNCAYKKLAWPLSTLQMISFQSFPNGCRELLALWGIGYRAK
jgi:MTH538 TIR-like domain (DUF1863).